MIVRRIFGWLDEAANRQMLFRRGALVWAIWLITVATLRYTGAVGKATMADAGIFGTITALMGVVVKLYFDLRATDEPQKIDPPPGEPEP